MLTVEVEKQLGEFSLRAAFESAGGATALFGASGAGKTTIFNMVAGLTRPDRGRIVLDGEVLFDAAARIDVPAWRRRISTVFQEGRLFPHLSLTPASGARTVIGWSEAMPCERWRVIAIR